MQVPQVKEKLQTSLLDIGDYLEIGWLEFTKNIQTFCIYLFIVNVPIVIMNRLMVTSINPETGEFQGNVGLIIFLFVISLILGTVVSLATHKIVERSINGQNLEAITAVKNSTPQIAIILIMTILVSIIVSLGFALFIIPGIWLAVNFSFINQAIALRDCNFNAMSYSKSLVDNRWWALFGRMFLLGIIVTLSLLMIWLVVGFIGSVISLLGLGFVSQIISSLIFGLITYYVLTINTVMFLNFDYTRD